MDLKGVFAKNEKGDRFSVKISGLHATNLTSICCVYEEIIPKNVASIQIQKVGTFNSDRKKPI